MAVPVIKSAEFLKAAVKPDQYPGHDLPEIAFAGRSNVGKSSLINRLLNRKKLVRTSSTPGRTQMLNFFVINEAFCFVDLPGYGYAKAPKALKKGWGLMVNTYIRERNNLKGVVLILDVRRKPSEGDIEFFHLLSECRIPVLTVATKVDKLSANKQSKALKEIAAFLGKDVEITPFSALSGQGRKEVWEAIDEVVSG